MGAQIYTIEQINALRGCTPAERYLPANWSGTLIEGIHAATCTPSDKVWAARNFMSDAALWRFTFKCAQCSLDLMVTERQDVDLCKLLLQDVHWYIEGQVPYDVVNRSRELVQNENFYTSALSWLSFARYAIIGTAWMPAKLAALATARDNAWAVAQHATLHDVPYDSYHWDKKYKEIWDTQIQWLIEEIENEDVTPQQGT